MKIDNSIKTVGNVPSSEHPRPVQNTGSAGKGPEGEKVELTSLSSSMQRADAAMANTTVVDQGKVDEIKQAMANGEFKVDAEKVADELINSVKDMLAAQTPAA
jgi:negative regulator of flagellin synthesis FlgM